MSFSSLPVWFLLLDSVTGQPYKGTSADYVSLPSTADVADFRDAVKSKHSNKLSSFDAADLLVYANKSSFDKRNAAVEEGKQEPLDPSQSLGLLGSKEDMLVVVVPIQPSQTQASSLPLCQVPIIRESIATYWRVSGTISDSLPVKEDVLSRMYENADDHLGYYESGQPTFFFGENGTTLCINVLFETEENALCFDRHLRNESILIHSPMNRLKIHSVVSTTSTAQLGERIYYEDYIPPDSEDTPQSGIKFSAFEQTSDEFKYQRIEKMSVFGSFVKAESCPLMSGSHCKKYPSYSKYDKDPNNRLAMSRGLHGWFANLNTVIPFFYLKVVSISESVIVKDRYRVEMAVVAFNEETAGMVFSRLIEGSTQTNDPLVMHTSVLVTNPTLFQKCLEWRENETKKKWADYCSRKSAAP